MRMSTAEVDGLLAQARRIRLGLRTADDDPDFQEARRGVPDVLQRLIDTLEDQGTELALLRMGQRSRAAEIASLHRTLHAASLQVHRLLGYLEADEVELAELRAAQLNAVPL